MICLLLLVSTLIPYWQVHDFDFVNLDEPIMLLQNPRVTGGLTLHNILWGLTTSYFEYWHPVTWWSHMLDFQLFGADAGPQHVVSLGFHIANTLILFAAVREMTGMALRSAVVAALFALHPMHVESVAWLAERKDVLSTFFWLLTVWSYVLYVKERRAETPKAELFFRLSLVCFLLGIMSKPMVVTLPCALLLLDFWPLRRIESARLVDWRERPVETFDKSGLKKLFVEKLPFFGLTLISSVITLYNVKAAGNIASDKMLPLSLRLANVPVSYARYVAKLVWPSHMVAFYPIPSHWPAWEVAGSIILLILITVFSVLFVRRAPYLLFGWCLFIGTIFPTISLVPVGMQSIADRYTYLPYIGLFIAVTWAVAEWSTHWPNRIAILGSIAGIILFSCSVATQHQTAYWRDSFQLWPHCLAWTKDNLMAEYNYAFALQNAGRNDEAIEHYHKTLRINPDHVRALINLGRMLAAEGKTKEATNYFFRAAEIQPGAALVQDNLGVALFELGDNSGAILHCSEAVRLDPQDYRAMQVLARALAAQGRSNDALQFYEQALRLAPADAEGHYYFGLELLKVNRPGEAISEFNEALHLNPSFTEAQKKLEDIQKQQGAENSKQPQ